MFFAWFCASCFLNFRKTSGNLNHASRLLCLFRLLLNAGIARGIERSRGSWIGSFAFRQPPNQTSSRHRVNGTNEEYCYSEAKIRRSESKCPNFRGIEIWQRLQTIENSAVMDCLLRLSGASLDGMGGAQQPADAPVVDTAEQVSIKLSYVVLVTAIITCSSSFSTY